QPPSLLQSIAIAKMTGRLLVQSDTDTAEIFFEDGTPVHAATREGGGESAIVDLMLWEVGDFQFMPDEKSNQKTVTRRLESLVMEGVSLLDQHRFLLGQNVKMESYMLRNHASLSEQDFEKAVSKGAPVDLL